MGLNWAEVVPVFLGAEGEGVVGIVIASLRQLPRTALVRAEHCEVVGGVQLLDCPHPRKQRGGLMLVMLPS